MNGPQTRPISHHLQSQRLKSRKLNVPLKSLHRRRQSTFLNPPSWWCRRLCQHHLSRQQISNKSRQKRKLKLHQSHQPTSPSETHLNVVAKTTPPPRPTTKSVPSHPRTSTSSPLHRKPLPTSGARRDDVQMQGGVMLRRRWGSILLLVLLVGLRPLWGWCGVHRMVECRWQNGLVGWLGWFLYIVGFFVGVSSWFGPLYRLVA